MTMMVMARTRTTITRTCRGGASYAANSGAHPGAHLTDTDVVSYDSDDDPNELVGRRIEVGGRWQFYGRCGYGDHLGHHVRYARRRRHAQHDHA